MTLIGLSLLLKSGELEEIIFVNFKFEIPEWAHVPQNFDRHQQAPILY